MTTKFEDVKFQFKKDVLIFLDKHIEKYGRLEIRYQVIRLEAKKNPIIYGGDKF